MKLTNEQRNEIMGETWQTDSNWVNFLQSFGRMEGKIDQVISGQELMKLRQDEQEARLRVVETTKDEDHENRIRILEKSGWKNAGIATAVATAIAMFAVPILQALEIL